MPKVPKSIVLYSPTGDLGNRYRQIVVVASEEVLEVSVVDGDTKRDLDSFINDPDIEPDAYTDPESAYDAANEKKDLSVVDGWLLS
jgi:hypothetical protein